MNNTKLKIFTPVNIIGFILITMAGWVDIVGLELFFGGRSSFMTGRASILAISIVKNEMKLFFIIVTVVFSFILGAYIGTLRTKKHGLSGGLLTTSLLLLICAFLIIFTKINSISPKVFTNISILLIPMSMGCMNASTSLTPVDRTSHLTGPTTDIGIALAKKDWNTVVFWTLRWIGFILGVILGYLMSQLSKKNIIPLFTLFFIPSIVISVISFILKKRYET